MSPSEGGGRIGPSPEGSRFCAQCGNRLEARLRFALPAALPPSSERQLEPLRIDRVRAWEALKRLSGPDRVIGSDGGRRIRKREVGIIVVGRTNPVACLDAPSLRKTEKE